MSGPETPREHTVVLPALRELAEEPIGGYGVLADGRSAALVSRGGSVDWWCPRRFDGPSVFAAILDPRRGGRFVVGPEGEARSRTGYVPDTNVLETVHETASGAVRVVDFLALPEHTGVDDAVLLRRLEGLSGAVRLEVRFEPRFAYGASPAALARTPAGLVAHGEGEALLLQGVDLQELPDGCLAGHLRVAAGDRVDLVLRHAALSDPIPFAAPLARDPAALEAAAVAHWRAVAGRTRFDGPDATRVRRSVLALKALQYAPTGAFVAAATTSLPETPGGVRNWDYRYAWIRDGVLMARALLDLGHEEDARGFHRWLLGILPESPDEFRIMYTVDGSPHLPERVLPHLAGHRRSAPVRVGNGAVHQRQLDVYGELFDFLHESGFPLDDDAWRRVAAVADWVAAHWHEPDCGIWEMRCAPRHFVLSKAMAWLCLQRGASLARARGDPAAARRWAREARRIRREVLARGYDPAVGAFVQAYDHPVLDASNLLLPLVGFLDPQDPRVVATVERTLAELTVDGLVYRYLGADDGVSGDDEGAFTFCTFWLVEVLALQGRLREARAIFDRIAERATSLGLYAEEIDVRTLEHLGNFPQGFPHAGLLQAAVALAKAEAAAGVAHVALVPESAADRRGAGSSPPTGIPGP